MFSNNKIFLVCRIQNTLCSFLHGDSATPVCVMKHDSRQSHFKNK